MEENWGAQGGGGGPAGAAVLQVQQGKAGENQLALRKQQNGGLSHVGWQVAAQGLSGSGKMLKSWQMMMIQRSSRARRTQEADGSL